MVQAVNAAELQAIRDHMRAGGPDGFGEWISSDGRVCRMVVSNNCSRTEDPVPDKVATFLIHRLRGASFLVAHMRKA
jgi:hypothetical protein